MTCAQLIHMSLKKLGVPFLWKQTMDVKLELHETFFYFFLFWVNWTQIKAQFKELAKPNLRSWSLYFLGYLVIKHRQFWASYYSMWENAIYGINCNIVKYILKIWIPQYYPYPIESEQVINLSSPLPLLQRERKRKFYWLRSEHMNPKLID